MGAALGVEAGVGEYQPLDGTAVEEMLVDDLLHVFDMDEAVPDGVGVDDDDGAVLALVETAKLIRADLSLEANAFDGVLERIFQLFAALVAAAWAASVFFPLVGAEEEMVLKLRHDDFSFLYRVVVRCTGVSETI
jgi:hypothetical protein